MIIKLDLEKAYDRMEWSFILESLELLHIPAPIINLINWNGNKSESFSASRGLRQGGPISPYLFVLALERLGHKIQDLVNSNIWKPLTFGRGRQGPKLSHICFSDDLVFFAEANLDQIQVVKQVKNDFCASSGQKVNLIKSKVFFSKNIIDEKATQLSNELGIEKTENLGNYLGAPLLHQRITKDSVSFILEKMRKKLSSWKSNSLSLAGRVTLAQSCLSCIPNHLMQTVSLPSFVCEAAESICRNFVWGSSDSNRKFHMISWEKICQPKEQGGLGFRNLKVLNKAYMTKLAWQLINNPYKLWVRIMKFKYNCGAFGL